MTYVFLMNIWIYGVKIMIGRKSEYDKGPVLAAEGVRLYTNFQNTALYRIGSVLYNDMDDIDMILFRNNSRIWWRLKV